MSMSLLERKPDALSKIVDQGMTHSINDVCSHLRCVRKAILMKFLKPNRERN